MDRAYNKFLTGMGCHKRGEKYILDGFSSEFYLLFDTALDQDDPKPGTCDILVCRVGSSLSDSLNNMRVVADATAHKVMRFMFALGVDQFSETTRKFLYESNCVIRTQAN